MSFKVRLRSENLRERLNQDSMRCVQNSRLCWFGHIEKKWMKVFELVNVEQLRWQGTATENMERSDKDELESKRDKNLAREKLMWKSGSESSSTYTSM